MEEGDLLGFDAPSTQEEAWDESDRASSSTYGDVPSFAKPPKLETQESVNFLDLGGSQVDSDQASVNLLEFTVSPINTRVDLMSWELPLPPSQPLPANPSSLPVDVFSVAAAAITTTTTPQAFPFGTKPTINSNIDVFADMVRTAKEMDAKTSPTNAQPQSIGSPLAKAPSPNHLVVQESTSSEPLPSSTIEMNQQVNGEPALYTTTLPEEKVALEQKEGPSSAKSETATKPASDESCTDNHIMQAIGTTVKQQSPAKTVHNGSHPAPPTLECRPNSKSDHQEPTPPATTNGLGSPEHEQPMPVLSNELSSREKQQGQAPPLPSSPVEGDSPKHTMVEVAPTSSPVPLSSPETLVGDTSAASHAPEATSSVQETETTPMTNGKKDFAETIVIVPNLPTNTIAPAQQATVNHYIDKSHSSPQATNNDRVDPSQNQQEVTDAADTNGPLTPDSSRDSNQVELLNQIQALEQQLQQAQSTILQLQEKHNKDVQDASAHGKLLVDLQSNLQTEMKLRAETEEKLRKVAVVAKNYKEKWEAFQLESKESMEQLGATLGKITAAKSNLELELEAVKQERDDKVRREATMASKLNVISKQVAEKANSAEYYEKQVDQLKEKLDSTKNQLSETTQERDHLKEELVEWKEYAEKRSKQLEAALAKEKSLNVERKRKMKQFVETKSEEVRVAKADCVALQSEIDQSNMAVKDMNQRYKQLHAQWVESQTRNRELQRDLTKMKKDSEKMSKVGGTLEAKLSRSAMESEDHKNKRLAAKNELMAVLKQLEAEREVNNRLRERIKMTFTPEVLNQQQSIREILDRFEDTMLKVATKLGRPLPPPPPDKDDDVGANHAMDGVDGSLTGAGSAAAAAALGVSEVNMQRVLGRLEHETKRVSQSIESINGSVMRLNSLVEAPSTRGCVDVFSALLMTSHT